MSNDVCPIVEKPRGSLNISVVAYECLPGAVFVRVPNERGRWLMTDRCVAEVGCPSCGALTGEPCHNGRSGAYLRYHVSTHCRRRDLAPRKRPGSPKPKLRIRAEDLEALAMEPTDV